MRLDQQLLKQIQNAPQMPISALERLQEQFAPMVQLQPAPNACLIAGIDISYATHSHQAVAGVAVLDAQTLTLVEFVYEIGECAFDYVPNFLAFRELPLIAKAMAKLTSAPDLFFYDGNGVLHQRFFGAASHFGLLFDVPTIGCSKNAAILLDDSIFKELKTRGDSYSIEKENKVIASVLVTQSNIKPIYVSVGHQVTLDDAVQLSLQYSSKYRIPEPIRLADQWTRRVLNEEEYKRR